jgi:hypothetical protein
MKVGWFQEVGRMSKNCVVQADFRAGMSYLSAMM